MQAVSGSEATLASPAYDVGVTRGFPGARCAVLSIGLLAHWAICSGFDYLLYPFVMLKMGVMAGGVMMLLLCFAVCYGTFLFYDRSKHDWLGIETLKLIREQAGHGASNKLVAWMLRQSTPVALVLLSLKFDPFVTTAYLRSGAHKYSGFSGRDWKIFLASLLIGNGYWMIASISMVEFGWRHFLH